VPGSCIKVAASNMKEQSRAEYTETGQECGYCRTWKSPELTRIHNRFCFATRTAISIRYLHLPIYLRSVFCIRSVYHFLYVSGPCFERIRIRPPRIHRIRVMQEANLFKFDGQNHLFSQHRDKKQFFFNMRENTWFNNFL
jgi:hypothetical protein